MRLDLLVNHFVYAAVTDGYLVIFEKDFKRNFVHVRDVADCFLHCIRNAETMAGPSVQRRARCGEPLQGGAGRCRSRSTCRDFYIHFAEVGSDPDKRNYIVSNQRLREAGFEARRGAGRRHRELLKGYRMMLALGHKNVMND